MAVEFNPRLLKDKGQPSSKPDEVVFRPETYLAAGDGVKDDSAALYRMSQAMTEAGGGVIELRPGATYLIGGQRLADPESGGYRFPGNISIPIDIRNCTRGVVVKGNGSVIRCASGAKYGTFALDGTPLDPVMPYLGEGRATPYTHMVYIENCKGVHIENLELDGNLNNATIGGGYGDTGHQISMSGLALYGNTGPVTIQNVYTHHHGLDGIILNGPAADETYHKECGNFIGVRSECNGRQGISIVGGKGWTFDGCAFNYTGKANSGSDTSGAVGSNPGAGVDLEAEDGKEIRDTVFRNCEFIGNYGQAVVADSGTDVDRTSFYDCTFIGTTNYALWLNRPGFKLYRCRILGACVSFWDGTSGSFKPQDAVYLEDCFQSNEVAQSPTGSLFDQNDLLWETGSGFVAANRCTFEHHLGTIGGGIATFQDHSDGDGPFFTDCRFIAKAGAFGAFGQFYGSNWFIEDGGVIGSVPGTGASGSAAEISLKETCGPSFGPWYFRTGGVTTQYSASHDGNLNGLGTRTYASDQNLTVTHYTDRKTQLLTGTITADRTVTLSGGKRGATFRFVRTGGGAFNWSIGGLKNLAVDEWCEVEYNGSAWVLVGAGAL